jgi:hypothetical protein
MVRAGVRRNLTAAPALAGESGGIAVDAAGFIINSADHLLPRSR